MFVCERGERASQSFLGSAERDLESIDGLEEEAEESKAPASTVSQRLGMRWTLRGFPGVCSELGTGLGTVSILCSLSMQR